MSVQWGFGSSKHKMPWPLSPTSEGHPTMSGKSMEPWNRSLRYYSSLCPQGLVLCLPGERWLKIFGIPELNAGGEGEERGRGVHFSLCQGPRWLCWPFLIGIAGLYWAHLQSWGLYWVHLQSWSHLPWFYSLLPSKWPTREKWWHFKTVTQTSPQPQHLT